MKQNIYPINFVVRFIILLITPVFFQYFAIGFLFHSIYWGVLTFVLLLWLLFIFISPLFGRIGCGWFCFMGTTFDFVGKHSFFKTKRQKPKIWLRLLFLISFLVVAFAFYFMNKQKGITKDFAYIPDYLPLDFNWHYKYVWLIDIAAATILALFLDKRWVCKNVCFMGTICSAGASYARLLPVINTNKCTKCKVCESACLTGISIVSYIEKKNGLVTNSECILCGKCTSACKKEAIKLKFIWNRKKYIKQNF